MWYTLFLRVLNYIAKLNDLSVFCFDALNIHPCAGTDILLKLSSPHIAGGC